MDCLEREACRVNTWNIRPVVLGRQLVFDIVEDVLLELSSLIRRYGIRVGIRLWLEVVHCPSCMRCYTVTVSAMGWPVVYARTYKSSASKIIKNQAPATTNTCKNVVINNFFEPHKSELWREVSKHKAENKRLIFL